ncbi:dCTP deaminase [Streptomyces sp. NBC_00210]|uniref:dCTP deaminase n=1 Tax=unclassified Streptomyces TaxID=2593676 RepID=UPI003255E432
MILTGAEISRQVDKGRITIDPFDERQLNPNSYNFRLGDVLKVYTNEVLDPRVPQPTRDIRIPPAGIALGPDRIHLGHTMEVLGSEHYVPIVKGRSSSARLGIFVHVTADLIDIGSTGQVTLQLFAVQPVLVYPGMLIGQVTFWVPEGPIRLYEGKYQGSRGPVSSLIHRDFAGLPNGAGGDHDR